MIRSKKNRNYFSGSTKSRESCIAVDVLSRIPLGSKLGELFDAGAGACARAFLFTIIMG